MAWRDALPETILKTNSSSPLPPPTLLVWLELLLLGAFLSTAFAYILYFDIIAKAGATNASLVTLIVPLFAILLGVAFLSERLHPHEIAGMALIGIGLVIFDGRLRAARIPPASKS
jgi:drug/metabolite transporter (DMT)-like permease